MRGLIQALVLQAYAFLEQGKVVEARRAFADAERLRARKNKLAQAAKEAAGEPLASKKEMTRLDVVGAAHGIPHMAACRRP